MQSAARAGQDKLEWSILDVEPEEWERRLADLGVAAAASGFPVYPAAPQRMDEDSRAAPRTWNERRILSAVVILVVLGSFAGYGVWRRAQEGIARMQGDVANAVKLESLHGNSQGRMPAPHESVQTIEFLGSAAQATVLVTRTLSTGGVGVQPELHFYVQTPQGWERSDPIAGFWGPTESLDTAQLHFVFGRRDRAVVEQVAPGVEAVYVLLRRATGQDLAGGGHGLAGGLLTIEIAPEIASQDDPPGRGSIRTTSPALYPVGEQEQAGTLGMLLRLLLRRQLLAAAAQKLPAKTQWQPLVQGFGAWLADSESMPYVRVGEHAAPLQVRYRLQSAWQLDDLLGDILRYDPQIRSMRVFTLVSDLEQQKQREAAAEQLVGYIAGTYGIDALPKLLQGFAQYEDWEELAPAVFGVSAAELEEGWHAAMREGAPLGTIR